MATARREVESFSPHGAIKRKRNLYPLIPKKDLSRGSLRRKSPPAYNDIVLP